MTNFLTSANDFVARQDDAAARQVFLNGFVERGLPTTTDEVWRYAPLRDFNLDQYAAPTEPSTVSGHHRDLVEAVRGMGHVVVTTVDGFLTNVDGAHDGLTVSTTSPAADAERASRYEHDSFATLHGALSPTTVTVTVAARTKIHGPVVIIHQVANSAAFPSVRLHLGEDASLNVVELYVGGDDALVVPVSEYHLAANARLSLATYQRLATSAWHVARTTAFLQSNAHVHQSVVGLGGHYDRARNDAVLLGAGAENELWTTYLGQGEQVHDLRSHQLHEVGRTRSTLLSKGAVGDHARSIYTGLIEIERGARRTDARQTNHNLLLSDAAHADTVPNLDIRENDVTCAHASSVGPLDELQRWYLESRGVAKADAERLMIQGFFNEMLVALPSELATLLEADIATEIDRVGVTR